MVATKPMTAEELAERGGDERVELIEGVLIRMSPTHLSHGVVVQRLNFALVAYLLQHPVGELWSDGQLGFLVGRDPDSVLAPDVALTARPASERSAGTRGWMTDVPFLVIEVASPDDRAPVVARKTGIYLRAGVREVWWVRPEERQVSVHRDDGVPTILNAEATLASDDLLPGFRLPLADLFR